MKRPVKSRKNNKNKLKNVFTNKAVSTVKEDIESSINLVGQLKIQFSEDTHPQADNTMAFNKMQFIVKNIKHIQEASSTLQKPEFKLRRYIPISVECLKLIDEYLKRVLFVTEGASEFFVKSELKAINHKDIQQVFASIEKGLNEIDELFDRILNIKNEMLKKAG